MPCLIKGTKALDEYIAWLKNTNVPLFEAGNRVWMRYHRCLVPASLKPDPLRLSERDASDLLRQSGALFVRYFSRTFEQPTQFWYTMCNGYNPDSLSAKMRKQIRRAHERCSVRRIKAEWLAAHGYRCYCTAFDRYQNAQPESEESFQKICLDSVGGPIEYWGVFVGDQLAGFQKCVVGPDYAACVVHKLDPSFLRFHSSCALKDTVLKTYVAEQGKTTYHGFRAISHDTEAHEFALKFGCQRVYCDLCVVYKPSVKVLVRLLYPFRKIICGQNAMAGKTKVLFNQENIRRSISGSV
jgi:hypothetical protein